MTGGGSEDSVCGVLRLHCVTLRMTGGGSKDSVCGVLRLHCVAFRMTGGGSEDSVCGVLRLHCVTLRMTLVVVRTPFVGSFGYAQNDTGWTSATLRMTRGERVIHSG
jgi:hypothetical protein